MFGDILRNNMELLSSTTASKGGNNPFWKALRDIAVEDIKSVLDDVYWPMISRYYSSRSVIV